MPEPVTLAVAFAAGLASFFTPCCLPVLPGYIGFVSGGGGASARRRIAVTSAFVLGFGIAFVLIGLVVGLAGSSLGFRDEEQWLRRIGGALIILFGLVLLGFVRIPLLDRDIRFRGSGLQRAGPFGGAVALGAAFGVGWSPCMGPILAGILILAGFSGSAATSVLLLAVYAAGLAVPFLVVGVFAERGTAVLRRFGRASRAIEVVGGVLLLAVGVAVFTGSLSRLQSLVI